MCMENSPLISVIVTTKNEEVNIRSCLEGIKNQTYSNIETIVVDNNSIDNTKKIAKEYKVKLYDKGPERSAQRNYGIGKGKGKYAMFVDADMTISEKVIEECVEVCEADSQISGLYIPEIIVGNNFWINVRRFERSFYGGTVIDCVRFFPGKAFEKVKGFDLSMTGPEDWDFDKKIRGIGVTKLIKAHIYHNEGTFDIKRYLEKKRYYSKTMDIYAKKWGRNDHDIKKQLGVYYRLFGVFTENKKWRKLIAHPILAFEMYFLRIIVGIQYLKMRRMKKRD